MAVAGEDRCAVGLGEITVVSLDAEMPPELRVRKDAPSTASGFTLIELLAMVAIIALLMALLMPAIGGVRHASRTVGCTAGLRQIGVVWLTFARDHEGRGPGRGSRNGSLQRPDNFSWIDILNYNLGQGIEIYPAGYGGPIQRWNFDVNASPMVIRPGRGQLVCPDLQRSATGGGHGGGWAKSWVVNANAVGGDIFHNWRGQTDQFASGAWRVDFGPGRFGKTAPHPYFHHHTLGAQTSLFRYPGSTFLIFDGRFLNDDTSDLTPLVRLFPLAATEAQSWGGILAFRHPGLRANFLMLDGRVESLPNTDATFETRARWVPF